jgi:hypothetical protein
LLKSGGSKSAYFYCECFRRKGRARTSSTNTPTNRRNRLNSTDSYLTSGDETLLSPHDNAPVNRPSMKDNDYKENTQGKYKNVEPVDYYEIEYVFTKVINKIVPKKMSVFFWPFQMEKRQINLHPVKLIQILIQPSHHRKLICHRLVFWCKPQWNPWNRVLNSPRRKR